VIALAVAMLLASNPAQAQNNRTTTNTPNQGFVAQTLLNQTGAVSGTVTLDNDLLVAAIQDPSDEMLGATLQPVSEVLRAQLDLPAGQGLLVSALKEGGPSAQAGLRLNDILLTLADKPLAAVEDVTKHLKAAGEAAVTLKVLRAGKPVTIQVRPVYRVTLGPVAERKTEYFIGVSIEDTDEAVRGQLGLGAQGVVVTDVVGGSPAEKAGVKKNDIILELGSKPIDATQTLVREVQAAQDKPNTLKILRAGKQVIFPVTGAVRAVETDAARDAATLRLWLANVNQAQAEVAAKYARIGNRGGGAAGEDLRQRLDHLEKEIQAIRATLDKVNDALKSNQGKKRD
jgi:C-terminal processing protease CtpA/Prc